MSEVAPYRLADNFSLGLDPTDPRGKAMGLEPQERAQRPAEVVALGFGRARLAPLDSGALLDPAVVTLDRPGELDRKSVV